jgi:hypothetical protein
MSDGLGFTTDKGSQWISDLQRHGDDDLPAITGLEYIYSYQSVERKLNVTFA